MTGVLALHEMLHETKRRQGIGVVLKLDFEKAYDSQLEVSFGMPEIDRL
jgi:hypothetical protein